MKTTTIKYTVLAIALALLAPACSKEESAQTDYAPNITFGVNAVETSTRAEIADNSNIESKTVYVYGSTSSTSFIYSSEAISYDADAKKWLPTNKAMVKPWDKKASYQFYGYTYLPANSPEWRIKFPTVWDKNQKKNVLTGYHKTFNVYQPKSYEYRDEFVDFLLSHTYNALGSARPIVQLQLEHAMALVDIYIVKHKSLAQRKVRVKSLSLTSVRTDATMTCASQAIANSGKSNEWQITFLDHTPATYTIGNAMEVALDTATTGAHLRIVAVPQQLTAQNRLTVTYEVDESGDGADGNEQMVEHTETFLLYNYTPIVWESGHRIVYRATIDTGIHLQGQIAAWKDVDYIEGTVLPDIPDTIDGD